MSVVHPIKLVPLLGIAYDPVVLVMVPQSSLESYQDPFFPRASEPAVWLLRRPAPDHLAGAAPVQVPPALLCSL